MEQNSVPKAKYFCENCGSEVKADAKVCPTCGKFFSSVRCPSCGYMGTVKDFGNGCPRCHYSMSYEDLYGEEEKTEQGSDKAFDEIDTGGRKKKRKVRTPRQRKMDARRTAFTNEVPMWLFSVCLILLVLVIGIIVFRFRATLQ